MRTQAKHTPGPWEIVTPDNPNHMGSSAVRNIEIHDGFGRTATVYGEIADEETHATARLIAAAPDYDSGARKAVEWLDLIKQNYPEMVSLIEGLTDLRAAIAKAETD